MTNIYFYEPHKSSKLLIPSASTYIFLDAPIGLKEDFDMTIIVQRVDGNSKRRYLGWDDVVPKYVHWRAKYTRKRMMTTSGKMAANH